MHLGNMQPSEMPFPENEENYPMDHPRNEEMPRESWRTYNDHPDNRDVGPSNEMHPENGAFHHNPEMRPGFEHHNNLGPPNRNRQDRFHPHPNRGEDDFMPPDNMPPRGGHPPFGDDMYPSGDMDHRNNHMGPGPGNEDVDFRSHKRPWNDGPGREDHFPPREFDGPPNFNSRRSGPMYHEPRGRGGPRGHYRGMRSSPYRIVNRGRGGRGGYK